MPELPDVEVYVDCLAARVVRQRIERVRLLRPFVLRSVTPPLDTAEGRTVLTVERLGKRIVIGLSDDLFLVLHLMIAGRLRWRDRGTRIPQKLGLAAFDFSSGTLLMTEAGSIKRAALHLVAGRDGLREHDRGGIEVLTSDLDAFRDALLLENHTLKRSLTDPRLSSPRHRRRPDLRSMFTGPVRMGSFLACSSCPVTRPSKRRPPRWSVEAQGRRGGLETPDERQ